MTTAQSSPRLVLIKLVFGWVVATGLLTLLAVYAWRHDLGTVSRIFWTALALWVGLSFPWRNRAALRLLFRGHLHDSNPIALTTDSGGRAVFECPGCGQDVPVNHETGVFRCPKCGTEFNVHALAAPAPNQ